MNTIKRIIVLSAYVGLSTSSMAWWDGGHMVVAQIAYNHLDPDVKTKCDALIAVPLPFADPKSATFVTAAVWADDFKGPLGTAIWHYIDLPFSLDGTPTTGVVPNSFDVVKAINQSISTLQNPAATDPDKATALRYLLHFVGDVHQPLHCCTAVSASLPQGDAGGNGFNLTGTWPHLHQVWDDGGGYLPDSLTRPLNATDEATLNTLVASIETDYPYTPHPGTIPDPMDWAKEGLNLAQTVAYVGITPGSTPSPAYLKTVQATAEQRVAIGGHRLADLLNTIFATPPPPPIGPLLHALERGPWIQVGGLACGPVIKIGPHGIVIGPPIGPNDHLFSTVTGSVKSLDTLPPAERDAVIALMLGGLANDMKDARTHDELQNLSVRFAREGLKNLKPASPTH